MSYLLRIVGLADGRPTTVDGAWVARCDVDAQDGRGIVWGTVHAAHAKHFETPAEALEYWKRQSNVMPFRPDGKPNRPLTAYTVGVEPEPSIHPYISPDVPVEVAGELE